MSKAALHDMPQNAAISNLPVRTPTEVEPHYSFEMRYNSILRNPAIIRSSKWVHHHSAPKAKTNATWRCCLIDPCVVGRPAASEVRGADFPLHCSVTQDCTLFHVVSPRRLVTRFTPSKTAPVSSPDRQSRPRVQVPFLFPGPVPRHVTTPLLCHVPGRRTRL